jgi:hypothetical protein
MLKAKIFAEGFAVRQILFPGNEQFWYETLRSFDHMAYGGADFGELLVISGQISEGDYGSWHDAYLAAADRIATEAGDALRAGPPSQRPGRTAAGVRNLGQQEVSYHWLPEAIDNMTGQDGGAS